MPSSTKAAPEILTPKYLRDHPLRRFGDDDTKAERGKLLIVGGSARLPGAALLAAKAALRAGCGTVRAAVPKSIATAIGVACPELMVIPLPETQRGTVSKSALQVLEEQFGACDAAIIGPGLDEDDETLELARAFVRDCPLPCVVDASAIEAASTCTFAAPRILTPHAGEMKSLVENFDPESGEETARDWAQNHGATLVLKSRATLIASPSGAAWRNTAGTRGLGTAGSGDVAAGVIGGLLAQGNSADWAAIYGVYLHALAGEDAAKARGDDGLMASDFLERVPFVRRELQRKLRQN